MSPELLNIHTYVNVSISGFSPEKSDIFSLGLTFLRASLQLKEEKIAGFNNSIDGS